MAEQTWCTPPDWVEPSLVVMAVDGNPSLGLG